jgi:hypothetical protein
MTPPESFEFRLASATERKVQDLARPLFRARSAASHSDPRQTPRADAQWRAGVLAFSTVKSQRPHLLITRAAKPQTDTATAIAASP